MNNTNHKIALQSKKYLTDALFELFDHYDYNAITISQICRKADLSRRTFYRVFKSKDEILTEKITQLTAEYMSLISGKTPSSYLDRASIYFEFWYNHKDILLRLNKSNILNEVFYKLQLQLPTICKALKCNDNVICRSNLLDFINAFGFGGMNSVLLEWIKQDMVNTPAEMTEALIQFLDSAKGK